MANMNNKLAFRFNGLILGQPMMVLADSGATQCFISLEATIRAGIHVDESLGRVEVEVANGEVVCSNGLATVQLHLKGYNSTVSAVVLPSFIPGIDIILGDSWLREHKTLIDYDATTFTVRKGNRRVHLSPCGTEHVPRGSQKAVNYVAVSLMKGKQLVMKGKQLVSKRRLRS